MMANEPIPTDCKSCGACCCHDSDPLWVEVTAEEAKGYSPYWTVPGDVEAFAMKFKDGKCKRLVGLPGISVFCTIYQIRPAICRKVQPGDEICVERLAAMRAKKSATVPG